MVQVHIETGRGTRDGVNPTSLLGLVLNIIKHQVRDITEQLIENG